MVLGGSLCNALLPAVASAPVARQGHRTGGRVQAIAPAPRLRWILPAILLLRRSAITTCPVTTTGNRHGLARTSLTGLSASPKVSHGSCRIASDWRRPCTRLGRKRKSPTLAMRARNSSWASCPVATAGTRTGLRIAGSGSGPRQSNARYLAKSDSALCRSILRTRSSNAIRRRFSAQRLSDSPETQKITNVAPNQ